jgi:hypothetical protein
MKKGPDTFFSPPDGPTAYSIGGYMTYELHGKATSAVFTPAAVTVYPDAKLDLNYFWQRDVYSDDPATDEVEPAEPRSRRRDGRR